MACPEQADGPKAENRGGKGDENVPRFRRQMTFVDGTPDVY